MVFRPEKSVYPAAPGASGLIDPIRGALNEQEDWYRDLVEHSQDLLCLHDLEGRLLSVNPAPARLLGYSVEEILEIPMRELIAPEFRDAFDGYLQQIARTGEMQGLMSVVTRAGERRIWEFHNTVRITGVVKPVVRGIAHDVTDRIRAERMLRDANADLNRAQSVAHIGSWSYDLERRTMAFSDETYRIVGIPKGTALTGERVMELFHPDDRVRVRDAWNNALASGHYDLQSRIVMQGELRWIQIVADIQSSSDGRPLSAVGTVQDITERKLAESNQLLLASIVETAADAIFSTTTDGIITSWNPGGERLYGYSAPEMIGQPLTRLVPDEWRGEFQKMMLNARNGKATTDLDTVRVRKDENRLNVSVTASPIRDQSGEITGISVVHRDITERKRTEEQMLRLTEELRMAKERLAEEKLYLEQEISADLGLDELIGASKALRTVMELVGKVAGSDATVLLLGETGTGKELVARAIHRLSARQKGTFIKMNCASIPSGLLESELFGYEKGAFTGAVKRKIGRLELASHGTLFLDEIGEVPLAVQPKLLRVLQDQEFERLGGTQTQSVDFRLIAATNRDLLAEVSERKFRSDLYYRLSVFPIRVPPLRERREDIPVLVEHFVAKSARRMNKPIISIPASTIEALMQWDWPGNVRELENFMERSVILTRGPALEAPLHELKAG